MGMFELSQAPVVFAVMGLTSVWHWLIVLVIILLLFGGRGKIPNLMKDVGSGINAFKKGLKEDKNKNGEAAAPEDTNEQKAIEEDRETVAATASESSKEEEKKAG